MLLFFVSYTSNSYSQLRIQWTSVLLTKEAHKIVHECWCQAAAGYHYDVENAWQKIDQSIADITVTHRKSIQCVQKKLHIGQSVIHTWWTVNAWNAWCAKIASEESSHTDSLLRKWKNGTIHWWKLTNKEYTRLENDHNKQIENGAITIHKHQTRSDAGIKWRSYGGHMQVSKKAWTTSDAVIASSDNDSSNDNKNTSGTIVPSPSGIVSPTPGLPLPPGVVSSPHSSSGTAVTSSGTTATTTPTGAGSIFNDLFNMDSNAIGRFSNVFTVYNDPNYFFDFDFGDATAPAMTF